jgi:hypothetical protein
MTERSKPAPKRERDRDYTHYPTFTVNGHTPRKPNVERPPILRRNLTRDG